MTDPTADGPTPGPDGPWAPPGSHTPDPAVPAIGPPGTWTPPAAPTGGATPPPLVPPPPSMLAGTTAPSYLADGGSGRPPLRTLAVAAALVVSLVAGVFGIVQVTAADGAGSPEGAVEALFDAIDREDVLGMVEALAPNERDLLLPAVRDLGAEAERLKISEDIDLAGVQGVDLVVEGLELEVEELAPGVADVRVVGGTLTGSARLADLPAGSVFQDLFDEDDEDDEDLEDLERPETESLAGLRLVARRSDGWHVSLLSSLAEEARRSLDPVPAYPSPDDAIAAVGAESPEAVVREALAAALDLDARRLIELTPPDEMAVLHEYGSILVDLAEEEADDEASFDLQELELTTKDGPDGTKIVEAETLRLVTTDDGSTTTYEVRDGCTTTSWEYPEDEYWDGDSGEMSWCEDDHAGAAGFFSFFGWSGLEGLSVATVQRDGAWYLSPTRTVTESILRGVRALEVEDIERFARFWSGDYWVMESDEFWEACGVDRPAIDTPDDEAEATYQECWEALPDDFDGWTWGWDPTFDEEWDFEDDPSWACYDLDTSAETDACLQDLLDNGEIDEWDLFDFRCNVVYDEYDDPTDEQWDEADERYEACMDNDGVVPPSVEPGPTTTVPSGPSTTTPSAPSTTTPPAPSTSTPATPSTTVPSSTPGD